MHYDQRINNGQLSHPATSPISLTTNRRRVRRSISALPVIIVMAAVVGLLGSPVGAHSALIETSPGLDATAGGTIDFVELAFNEPVSNAVITVSYNEEPLAGVTTVATGEIIRFDLDQALQLPGRYEVSFELISFDADRTTSSFFFTYELDAAPPARVGESGGQGLAEDDSTGTNWLLIGVVAFFLVSLVGLLALFVWRLDAKRQAETTF